MPEVTIPAAWQDNRINVIELVMATGQVSSKSEVRRLIQQGGLMVGEKKCESIDEMIKPEEGMVLRMGKRRFARVKTQK
jgi:tyrosyl-tRNA synthetase